MSKPKLYGMTTKCIPNREAATSGRSIAMEDKQTIAQRAVFAVEEAAQKNGISRVEECRRLDISPAVFSRWKRYRYSPSAYFLSRMALTGYDVVWILTGRRDLCG